MDCAIPLQGQVFVHERARRERRTVLRKRLAESKHAKLVLKTDQPTAYVVLLRSNSNS